MGHNGNSRTGKRSVAPLLISIFWLVSSIGAALGTAYAKSPEVNLAASEVGSQKNDDVRLAHEADNQSTPVQRPLRVAALEALHLKIKSGLRADSGADCALLPAKPPLVIVDQRSTIPVHNGSSIVFTHDTIFSARAPPLTRSLT
jgi:hypothetical protein